MTDLDRLAELVGVEPFYFDIWGNRRDASPATKRALIAAMGLPAANDGEIARSLRTVEERDWRRLLPPVVVAEEGGDVHVTVSLPAGLDGAAVAWTLTEESGAESSGDTTAGDTMAGAMPLIATRTLDGSAYEQRTLVLPRRPAPGYHTLAINVRPRGVGGALHATTTVVMAPRTALTPEEALDGRRAWGFALQLYGLRSDSDWGIGDFDDLGAFAEVAGGLGADLVGLNPLHALFPADPNHFGPYSPSSRRFLNVLYIDVEAVPEFAHCDEARAIVAEPAFADRLARAREADLVDYPAAAALKLPVLDALHRAFRAAGDATPRAEAFRRFRAELGEPLRRHALFDALHEHHYGRDPALWSWRSWPEEHRRPDSPGVAAFAAEHADRVDFYAFLQFEADRQLGVAEARARAAGLRLGFYRDLAVAANPGGAAAWADPEALVQGASVGAPPDQFNMMGQNWGLSPLSPVALRERAYEPFIAAVRANMRHAGALRIDHVMALKHLFWIPDGGGEGAYVRYPFQDMLRIVALESRRNRCVVIGEDLGTVPEGFRPVMQEAGVLSYRVLYFERAGDGGFLPPEAYPRRAMVTVSTHDLPTFRAFWTGRDLEWRRALSLYPDSQAEGKDAWDRGVDRWRLLGALAARGLKPASYTTDDGAQPWTPELTIAAHRYLAETPGCIMMVQIEDAVGETEQANLPGTTDQHPNWRRRLPCRIADIAGDRRVRALADAVARSRSGVRAAPSGDDR